MQIDILEAKNRLAELIKSMQDGDDVFIADRGKSVVRLASTATTRAHNPTPGAGRALMAWLDSHPVPARHRRSPTQIEAGIEEERGGWD